MIPSSKPWCVPWRTAMFELRNLIVVTQEASAPQSKTSITIPDACRAHPLTSIDVFERRLNIRI
ncbi:MAG: hypothetical protein BLM47_12080 [Candidatus Reconcilbacillus cellulovorans]|uniref:Uncharacterized protein n=1 Tax=Candidatus Reconcilbacillus cellulovorans TaxID=1906605 RepID=A0A2A6DXV0_9BACL|nr:MAG: hypothetical protein BLM47_12080 [Candidatus Reconcilbacillus cellulovorans]